LTADLVLECLQYSKADSTYLPPSVLEDLISLEGGFETLKRMRFVAFAGGKYNTNESPKLLLTNIRRPRAVGG
jgi:hypothetical protein